RQRAGIPVGEASRSVRQDGDIPIQFGGLCDLNNLWLGMPRSLVQLTDCGRNDRVNTRKWFAGLKLDEFFWCCRWYQTIWGRIRSSSMTGAGIPDSGSISWIRTMVGALSTSSSFCKRPPFLGLVDARRLLHCGGQ